MAFSKPIAPWSSRLEEERKAREKNYMEDHDFWTAPSFSFFNEMVEQTSRTLSGYLLVEENAVGSFPSSVSTRVTSSRRPRGAVVRGEATSSAKKAQRNENLIQTTVQRNDLGNGRSCNQATSTSKEFSRSNRINLTVPRRTITTSTSSVSAAGAQEEDLTTHRRRFEELTTVKKGSCDLSLPMTKPASEFLVHSQNNKLLCAHETKRSAPVLPVPRLIGREENGRTSTADGQFLEEHASSTSTSTPPTSCPSSPMSCRSTSSTSTTSCGSKTSSPSSSFSKKQFYQAERHVKKTAKFLAKCDPYWRHVAETLMLNVTVAKAATALGFFTTTFGSSAALFPLALASGTAMVPAPPPSKIQYNNRQIKTIPGPGSTGSQALTHPTTGQPLPKEEDQFMELIFPGFDSDTFIWNVTLAQVAAFGFTMFIGHQKANPTPCALYMLGASWGPALARGQVWRLLCPMMLHANMMHLFFNVFFQLRIGFGMERQFGKSKMRSLYVMCGVIGNLISVMLDPFKLAVGASTAGFGLIGVWIAEIVMSWELLGQNRDRTLIWILFMLVSVTTMSGMTPNMDLYGHFGGALGGFLMALVMADMKPEHRPPWYNLLKKLGFVGLASIFGVGLWKVGFHTPLTPIPDCPWFSDWLSGASHLGFGNVLPNIGNLFSRGASSIVI
ncbi:unnamed protein product [Amoebophrya sp. A120]|nr:unnamed protein product [Amoebophrya sp. A120]|eukprot:GSA120T00007091001.1